MKYWIISLGLIASLAITSCQPEAEKLPILGRQQVVDGKTVYHTIPDFTFINQDSARVSQEEFMGKKIYVADFFFTTCTTICPAMKTQMMRIYEAYQDDDRVAMLSHTIDPEYDTQPVLEDFASRLGISSKKWHFLTGVSQEAMFAHGQKGYIVTAATDKSVPDGILHSGAFLLVDTKGRIRGKYDGTKPLEVDRLIGDMKILLKEEGETL